MALWSGFRSLFSRGSEAAAAVAPSVDEEFWQQVYSAREAYFRRHIGPLPEDILKIAHLFGVWPGGGLYVIPAERIGEGLYVHTTFGFTNADMPASTALSNVEVEHDEHGRVTKTSGRLQAKSPAAGIPAHAGYGYELMVLTRGQVEWPLWLLQWIVNAEIGNDAGVLQRVEQYNGLTVEEIRVGENDTVNVLIDKAMPPLPSGCELPNGRMQILVATVITDDEMRWSMSNGRDALLTRLRSAGVGQLSDRDRESIVGPNETSP